MLSFSISHTIQVLNWYFLGWKEELFSCIKTKEKKTCGPMKEFQQSRIIQGESMDPGTSLPVFESPFYHFLGV